MSRSTQILGFLFAFGFLFSAYTKWIAPGYFEITVLEQDLVQTRTQAAHLTRFIIGLELGFGFCLLLPFYRKLLLVFAMLLITGLSLHLLYLWSTGYDANCGCFGEMIAMTPLESLFKNMLLLLLGAILYKRSKFQKRVPRFFVLVPLLFLLAPWVHLPIPNFDNLSFSSYTHFEKAGRVDLNTGEQLVGVFNLDCEHCQQLARELAKWELEQQQKLPLYLLFFREGSTSVAQFEALTQSNYPYAFIDTNTFFSLIGESPPRIYHLINGEIMAYWDEDFIAGLESGGFDRE